MKNLILKLLLIAIMPIPLPKQLEEDQLEDVQDGERMFLMAAEAARAWVEMKTAALADGKVLILVSAFRSVARQREIIEGKRRLGIPDREIFRVNAQPGFSEHHTGRAIDLTTLGCPPLEERFEHTDAFRWLTLHAHRFGFRLSYARDNPYGIAYEPWHWFYQR